jgi:hypothetical protein
MISVSVSIAPIDGAFWVHATMDGKTSRYGSYSDAATAEVMGVRVAAVCRAFNWVVDMHDMPTPAVARGR